MAGPTDEDEVAALSDAYEAALLRNDIDAMNDAFWHDDAVLRFGIADMQHGFDEIVAWRAGARPVNPSRKYLSRNVCSLTDGVVAVDITFDDGGAEEAGRHLGRQSQIWVRRDEGWRIVRAHDR